MSSYYLVQLKPARSTFPADATQQEISVVGAHFEYYKGLCEKGTALVVGRTDEMSPTGIALVQVANLAEAEKLMKTDPAVAKGIMVGKVAPFRLALHNTESLLKD